jgi:5-hydroxyisourate hydrolase-like protein (transthyretin family)
MSLPIRRVRVLKPALSCFFAFAAALVPSAALAQNGSISGTVTNSATSSPVANADVNLCSVSTNGGTSCFGATTNASGSYTRTLPPGTYYAYTADTGLVNEIFNNIPCPGSACSSTLAVTTGTPIVVTANAATSGRDFALDPGGSISGTVTDAATGNPLTSVFVSVSTRVGSSSSFVGSANTDAAGVYTFSGLPTGTYHLSTSNGIGFTNEIYDNVLCVGGCSITLAVQSGNEVNVVNGQTTTGRNFALEFGGRITGTVVNSVTAAPVQGVTVSAYARTGDSMTFAASGSTNASGVYTIAGLPTSTYFLATSNSQGLINESYNDIQCAGSCVPTVNNLGTPVPVTLGAVVPGIDFRLEPGGSVTGTVTDANTATALSNQGVSVYRQVGSTATSIANMSTNASGAYNLTGLPTGNYFVATASTTHLDEAYNNISCGSSCATTTILGSTPVAVTAGAPTPGINFALERGGTITGTVTDATTGAPLANIPVTVTGREVGSGTSPVTTGANGVWTAGGLTTGTYVAMTESFSGASTYRNEIYNDIPCAGNCTLAAARASGTPITVALGGTVPGIDFGLVAASNPPGTPTNFNIKVNTFTARLSWNPPTSGALATSYVIEAGVAPGQTLVTFTTTATSFTIPGVPPGRFYLRVRGVNAAGQGNASTELALVVNADGSGVLAAPTNFAGRMNGGRLTVTWGDASSGGVPAGYVLEVGTGAGLSNVASLPVAARNFTFEPVPNGVYFIRVRARQGAQLSPPSGEAMVVIGNVPSPTEGPRSLTHTVSGSTVTFTWLLPVSGTPTSYVLEAGSASGLADIVVFPTGSTALTAAFNGVPAGTYYVRVRAVNAQGRSVASNERTVTVQ